MREIFSDSQGVRHLGTTETPLKTSCKFGVLLKTACESLKYSYEADEVLWKFLDVCRDHWKRLGTS